MNTFEITIQRASDGNWPIVVRHQSGPIALTSWAQGTCELDLKRLDLLLPTDHQYGKLLGQNIFREEVHDAFVRAVSGARANSETLRVLLIIEAENLRSLHWEQLCAPYGSGRWDYLLLNQQTPYSLYLPSQIERRFPPIGRRDLRALLLVAGPEELEGDYGLATFDVPATIAALTASMGEIPHDVLANSGEGSAGEPSLRSLTDLLTDRHYTLLIIVSHGVYRAEDSETILYFPEDERHRPVTGSRLIERLSRIDGPRGLPHFTFLSTCESADPRAENGLGGLGQRLVRELGMPAVLAMTDRVSIQTAQDLSTSFCARLSEHGEVDRALVEALTTIKANYDLTVPALFSRLGGRPLFSDALDRPLTASEIKYGLEQLSDLLEERAPVLIDEFLSYRAKIQSTLNIDPDALSQEARSEREAALSEINQLSNRVLDISFNALALSQKPPEYDPRPPFRGLYPFRAEDREFFFGRQALIDDLMTKLDEHNFLAVLGPSGCGKSSLVLAGLVPVLGAPMAYMTPSDDPVANLENALAAAEPESLLVVDQFEEVFTLCRDQTQRETFLGVLLDTTGEMPVVVTMRADFLGECAAYPGLRSAIEAHQALIGPMSAEELRGAMERQADHVGLRFEAGLGEQILDDVQGEPGAMPLLQHALLLLWQRRHGRWLRWEEYTAIGGIQEAIAHTAEEVYAELSEHERRRMRDILIRLTRPPEEDRSQESVRYTRRRVRLTELVPAVSDQEDTTLVVNCLADARLLVTRQREGEGEVEVEVAHEALLQHWPRLRNWLQENRADILLREALTQAARDWESLHRDAGALYRGARLAQASEWAGEHPADLNILEQEFLSASQALMEREQDARERQRNRILVSALVVAIVMTFLGLFAFNRSQVAGQQAATATYAQGQALNQAATATYAQGQALYQASVAQTKEAEAVESGLVAEAQRLRAQGQLVFDQNPLLGLQLVLEGWELLPSGNAEAHNQLQRSLRDLAKGGRLQLLGSNIEQIHPVSNGPFFVVGYDDIPAELRRTDSDEVVQLSGRVVRVYPIPASSLFVVGYFDAPAELRRTDSDEVVQLSGRVGELVLLPPAEAVTGVFAISDSPFFVVDYDGPGELRRTESDEVVQLSGEIFEIDRIPESPFFVVSYDDTPGELRRTDSDEVSQLSGEIFEIDRIPDSPFFAVTYIDAPGELRRTDSDEVVQLSGEIFEIDRIPNSPFLVVSYDDTLGELRRTDSDEVVQLSGEIFEVDRIPDSPFFAVTYVDAPGELRRTDSAEVVQLSGSFFRVHSIPDSPLFVVDYGSAPGELRRTESDEVVQLSGIVSWVHPIPDSPLFVVNYENAPAELRRTDSDEVVQLSGDFAGVGAIPDSPFFAVTYLDAPGELRRTDSNEVVQLSGEIFEIDRIPDSPLFVVGYDDTPGELRRTDSDEVVRLSGIVSRVHPIPDSPLFVVEYGTAPGELRRTDSDEVVQFLGIVSRVQPIPNSRFFVIAFFGGQSELWGEGSAPLLAMGLGLESTFLSAGNRLVVEYTDGRGYLIDMDWLQAMGGRADAMPIEELMDILCEGPLSLGWMDEDVVQEYLGERNSKACK